MVESVVAERADRDHIMIEGTDPMAETVTNQDAAAPAPSEAEVTALFDELNVSPDSNLIGVLQQVQDSFGYLSPAALKEISRRTKIRLSRIYGVVTFYAQFYTEPRGRHTIRVCRGTACYVRGGRRVLNAVKTGLGIEEEETTEDMMFTLQTVACLGACALGPVMVVDSTYHGKMDPRKAVSVLQMYRDESG